MMRRMIVPMGMCLLLLAAGRGSSQEQRAKDATEPVPALDDDPAQPAAPCSGAVGGWSYCGERCLCARAEGDCDTDEGCAAGLYCTHDVGTYFGWDARVDVCLEKCPAIGLGGWTFCSEQCPCGELEGDCDGDEQCALGLVCVHDTGAFFGWHPELDVCMHPDTAASQPNAH